MLQGLYVLTDNRLHSHQEWPERVEQAILGGAKVIQLRDKQSSDQQLIPVALLIKEICRDYAVTLIVNDRISLARQIQADGVHIGQQDQSLRNARRFLGNKFLIGVSCYKNLFKAVHAQNLGADYVAFGSVFQSATKQDAPRCPLSVISQASVLLKIPVCAIGGIEPTNVKHVVHAGATLVAATHSVFNARDPMAAANKMNQQVIMRHY